MLWHAGCNGSGDCAGITAARYRGVPPMSLFGSMTTAISGLNAQSHALSNISGNVANSQTTGFKRLDTSFEDLVAQSARLDYVSGGVKAENQATTNIQGTVEQVEDPLSLALGGRGFFSVARPVSRAPDGTAAFDPRPTYSRAGDFSLDRDGYLVNSNGYVLRGWMADGSGTLDRSTLSEIKVSRGSLPAQPTTEVFLSANLPSEPAPGAAMSTTTTVYDALGNQHPVSLIWSRTDENGTPLNPNTWRLTVSSPDPSSSTPQSATFTLEFNGPGSNAGDPPAGTLKSVKDENGNAVQSSGIPISLNSDVGMQSVKINLGALNSTGGLTQFAGTEYNLRSISQDGAPAGAFSSLTFRETGDVVANYDNGQSRTIARVPVVTFPNSDALERLDGQAFAATAEAGPAQVTDAGRNGAAKLDIGAVERSNVDIAAEFSKLIVAQRAYTANTRIVTAADEMLQDTINMRR